MPVVTFSKPVAFPIAAVRTMLSQHLPSYRWQVGEDDNGTEKQMGTFHPLILITGRAGADCLFVELRAMPQPLDEAAPPHAWHCVVGEPTTDAKKVADHAKLSIVSALMFMDESRAACRLHPAGNWLRIEELFEVFKRVHSGEDASIADGFGTPAAHFAAGAAAPAPRAAPSQPPAPTAKMGPDVTRRMLSPLILMLDRTLSPNWWQIEEFARKLDPDGGWSYGSGGGMNVLEGRGTRIIVEEKAEPVPAYVYGEAFPRSFWYSGDPAAVARHSRHIAVGCALDTGAADWVTTRQVAKVVTLVTGILARLPGTVAVLNLTIGTIFEPVMVGNFLSILGRDQLPIPLWTFTAPHSLEDGDVSLSTSGLTPFLGHELEVWNAPLPRTAVQDRLSNLIIYLLDRGPVIGHGDTAGYVEGERAIRCFLGPSRAERAAPVQALFLEFEAAPVTQPRPDLPQTPPPAGDPDSANLASEVIDEALRAAIERSSSPGLRKILGDIRQERSGGTVDAPPAAPAQPTPAPPQPGFGRRTGGFGRKGL